MQPIVDLAEGRLAGVGGAAALAARNAGRAAAEFVPLAEESGLIAEIERFALARACSMALELSALHREPISVSVDVSPRHVLQGDLPGSIEEALRSTGFDAGACSSS